MTAPASRSTQAAGQAAYEAFYAGTECGAPVPWAQLTDWDEHWERAAQAAIAANVTSPTAEDYDHAAAILNLHSTLRELLGEFGLSGSHFTASISREHMARLRARLADV